MNPAAYVTPDVVADFTSIALVQVAENVVRMDGVGGSPRPADLKVSVGAHNGFFGEGQISYAGSGALARADLACEVLASRLKKTGLQDVRFDLIGVNSIHGSSSRTCPEPYEVRVRAVASI